MQNVTITVPHSLGFSIWVIWIASRLFCNVIVTWVGIELIRDAVKRKSAFKGFWLRVGFWLVWGIAFLTIIGIIIQH